MLEGNPPWQNLFLDFPEKEKTFQTILERFKEYQKTLPLLPVNPEPSLREIKAALLSYDFSEQNTAARVISTIQKDLEKFLLHVDHPMYFGVFNPNPLFSGVVADFLVAAFNPQLASSTSALYAIEVEKKMISYLAAKAGYSPESIDGTFCSGGTEANLTGVLCALARKLPDYFEKGAVGLKKRPAIYVSAETHHSIAKAVKILGLGREALRVLPVDSEWRFSLPELRKKIALDREQGFEPLLIVGTLGSTSAGIIDPLDKLAGVAQSEKIDFHVDAAWGGAALILPEYKSSFRGIEEAHSFSIDAHKWFAVPMGAGIFVSKHPGILNSVFSVAESPYMPPRSYQEHVSQPYSESLHWSRRFMGLKFLMSFMMLGEQGYQNLLRHSISLGGQFKTLLKDNEWEVVNDTPWPVACFLPKGVEWSKEQVQNFVNSINKTGKAWITSTQLGSKSVIRVGFPNFATKEEHLYALLELLNETLSKNLLPH